MKLIWDEQKRQKTLAERRLDFADCAEVFAGATYTYPDPREYGEERFIAIGTLRQRMVVVVFTERDSARRIISMRKANGREKEKFAKALA